ncbi:hydroxymethylbilane synthase [Nocardia thailandica]|uniref:hydroxymethylbilane synthase n=1 Tax=Nocardia thailandica TaxID=257275 RepID=UPI0005BCAFB4|nr:hydroxymethylbilane synthase [Nocardia thailandica]
MPERVIRLSTRSSPMAVHQAEQVAAALERLGAATELVKLTTAGDRWMGDLAALGGKGAFVKEIDAALLTGEADLAVHCLKDIPGDIPIPAGLAFAAYLEREDVHDAVISRTGTPLAELPAGAIVGTSSVRRAAQLRLHHPQLDIKPLRGNVNTRLDRLDAGHFDAIIAAVSGLHRVGHQHRITETLSVERMCPPVGAGIIVLQCREDDTELLELAARLDHPGTRRHAAAERAMLHALQGHCNSPIAGLCTDAPGDRLVLRGTVFSPDGTQWLDAQDWGVADDPEALGFYIGANLLRQGGRKLIDSIPH